MPNELQVILALSVALVGAILSEWYVSRDPELQEEDKDKKK